MYVVLVEKNVWSALRSLEKTGEAETVAQKEENKAKSIMNIFNALGETPLRAVMTKSSNCPERMWKKLEIHFFTSETAYLAVATDIANKKLQSVGNIMSYMQSSTHCTIDWKTWVKEPAIAPRFISFSRRSGQAQQHLRCLLNPG